MEDKVIKVDHSVSEGSISTRDGVVPCSLVIEKTKWESGREDVTIKIPSLNLSGKKE